MRLFIIPITDPLAVGNEETPTTGPDPEALTFFAKATYAFLKEFNFPSIFIGAQARHVDWIMVGAETSDTVLENIQNNFGEKIKYDQFYELFGYLSETTVVGLSIKSLGTFALFWPNSREIVMTIGSSDEYWIEHGFKNLKYTPIERTSDLISTDWFDLFP